MKTLLGTALVRKTLNRGAEEVSLQMGNGQPFRQQARVAICAKEIVTTARFWTKWGLWELSKECEITVSGVHGNRRT